MKTNILYIKTRIDSNNIHKNESIYHLNTVIVVGIIFVKSKTLLGFCNLAFKDFKNTK